MDYRELVTGIAMQNVFDIVQAWATGQASKSPDLMQAYARLVGDGIAGKDI